MSVVGFGDECGLERHTNPQTRKCVFKRDMNWGGLLFLIIRPPCHPLHTPFGLFKICPCRSLHRRKYCFLRCVAGNVSREQTVTLIAARARPGHSRGRYSFATCGEVHGYSGHTRAKSLSGHAPQSTVTKNCTCVTTDKGGAHCIVASMVSCAVSLETFPKMVTKRLKD